MPNFYAGIGSRETPVNILNTMTKCANRLANRGYILRSGGAPGADFAFERGAGTAKEIYLPWKGFNGSSSQIYSIPSKATEIAAEFHPAWSRCSDSARKLHSRNVLQILGYTLNSPVSFVLCWTKDGKASGGTGQAIRIAEHLNIPVFNLHSTTCLTELKEFLSCT